MVRLGRPPGRAKGQASQRERLYEAQAIAQELKNRLRRKELVETRDLEVRWSRLVTAFTAAMQNLVGTVVQRGLVAREREAELQALVDDALTRLSERRPGA